MKLRFALISYMLLTLVGGVSGAVSFWAGNLTQVKICEGFCNFLLSLSLWGSQLLFLVGWMGALLLVQRRSLAIPVCYTYFLGTFVASLPTVIILTQRFGPVWIDSAVPYEWEILKLGWPLVGAGMLLLFSSRSGAKPNQAVQTDQPAAGR